MNMQMPVGVIARLMPFHEATIWNFCRAVSGSRGSGAAGGGGSPGPSAFWPSDLVLDDASLPSSQPMSCETIRVGSQCPNEGGGIMRRVFVSKKTVLSLRRVVVRFS